VPGRPAAARGHAAAGVVALDALDALDARRTACHFRAGMAAAGAAGDRFHSSLLRFDLARALIQGGGGGDWALAEVRALVADAEARLKMPSHSAASLARREWTRRFLHEELSKVPPGAPPAARPCALVSETVEASELLARADTSAARLRCKRCGEKFVQLMKCG
jgi:hypothetical protein